MKKNSFSNIKILLLGTLAGIILTSALLISGFFIYKSHKSEINKFFQPKSASKQALLRSENFSKDLTLRVNPTKVIRPISPLIYGSNLAAKVEFELDVMNFAKEIGVTNLRFPGGGTPGYRWKLEKFDFDERVNTAPLRKMTNVIEFAKRAGASLFIQVNLESGTPQEAAEWVNYMNYEAGFRVDYWELGNEAYGDWDKDYMSGDAYAKVIAEYSAAMKAVDPTIKIGADFGGFNYLDFDSSVLKNAADYIDFVSFHWYPNHVDKDHPYKDRIHPLPEEIMANSTVVPGLVNHFNSLIEKYAPQRKGKIEITFPEWDGSWDGASSDLQFEFKGMMWSLANGIFYADALGQFAVNGVTVANQFSLQEVMFGLIRGWDVEAGWGGSHWDKETIRPKALALKLFARYFGDTLIESELRGSPAYEKEKDWRADSYTGKVPYVTAYASKFSGQNKLAIVLINKHSEKDFNVTISLKGSVPQEEGRAWILNGPDLSAQNDGTPGRVSIKEFALKGIREKFICQVPAHCVKLIQIELKP